MQLLAHSINTTSNYSLPALLRFFSMLFQTLDIFLRMFSTIFITAFAMGLICTVSGLDSGPKDPYEALIDCGQAALEEDADDLKVKGGHWNSPEEKIDESCVALGVSSTAH